MNVKLVGIDLALDDALAQAPGGVDQDSVLEAGLRVDGEHDAGTRQVGTDHLLDADREGDLQVVEALFDAISDGSVGEERGHAALDGVEQGVVAADVEIGVLLAGKARPGQVFGRGGRTHGDIAVGSVTLGHGRISGFDRLLQVRRQVGGQDRLTHLVPSGGEVIDVIHVQALQGFLDDGAQFGVVDKMPIGFGGDGEARRQIDAARKEPLDHLAEGGVLAADLGDVAHQYLLILQDERRSGFLLGHKGSFI